MNLLIGVFKFYDYESALTAILSFFDSGNELTFPTWFASLLLASGGVGSAAAARSSRDPVVRRGFLFLAAVMFYLSIDEGTGLHERVIEPIRAAGDLPRFLYFAWVIPAAVVVVVVAVLFIPFLRRLSRPVRVGFLTAGMTYVLSALGLEMVAAVFFTAHGAGVLTDVSSMVEETGEMLAAILLARTAFLVVGSGLDNVRIHDVFMLDALSD